MATIDEPHAPTAAGPAAGDEPARSVSEEAALLVELLSRRGWGAGGGMPSASSHPHATSGASDDDNAADDAHAQEATTSAEPGTERRGIPLADGAATHECTCGGREPAACRVCPVCQLISFVQQVNPDTIERVADFVGFAATALRDLASAQRERSERGAQERPS